MTTNARPVKKNGYSSAALHAKCDRKRREAEARNREWNSKMPQEQIEICHHRRGACKKQVARLAKQIDNDYKVATGAVKTAQYARPLKEVLK